MLVNGPIGTSVISPGNSSILFFIKLIAEISPSLILGFTKLLFP